MKPRDYCCCAIPIVNAGIYATLIEQFVLGILVGILSMVTPTIVGAATPSFAPWLFGIVCIVAGAIQILGLIGVAREKSTLFRRYVTLHLMAIVAAFAIAAAWIIVSASRHSTAQTNCITNFYNATTTTVSSEGKTLCNIFPWVDVGIMGGLWAVLGLAHIYFYVVLSSYGTGQRRDHEKYDALNDSANDSIPMNTRGDPWDSRISTESLRDAPGTGYNHVRQESAASMSDVLSEQHQQPRDGLSDGYGYQGSYPQPQGQIGRNTSSASALPRPGNAYTEEPGPTPQYNNTFYGGSDTSNLNRPPHTQAHPAEGSFGRKTPRLPTA